MGKDATMVDLPNIFRDLREGFDTVSHSIILRKLSSIAMAPADLYWFNSYLTGRTQVTRVSGKTSSNKLLKMGVPQGFILGPTHYQMTINDLAGYIVESLASMFQDDSAIYSSAPTHDKLELILQDDLHSVSQWLL